MPIDRVALHEKIAFDKWEGYAKAIERDHRTAGMRDFLWTNEDGQIAWWDRFVGSADWARLMAVIGLDPRGLRGQDYTVHFLRDGGAEG
ncbi:hypothetical protein [Mycolicibacterium hippocampi]|uniref:Uncharacterized protein n=1 Tax=Mycolicibacterium hippocampi TaxID=659824 RepID=A0A7I9ZST8_9MYCO|nr:hypothetical protein [Mycolicibacterium hippocampi]GFH03738.1 hypothetical protein MHIP_42210 [Mycolicibacterium hippocampi]